MSATVRNEAYEEARTRIAQVAASRETRLNLSIGSLETLPPEISSLNHVTELILDGSAVQDLSPIASLRSLESLSASNSPLADISVISELTELRSLDLHLTDVRDLSPIANLKRLEFVDLAYLNVSDVCMFSGFQNLRLINMKNNSVLDYRPFRSIRITDNENEGVVFSQCVSDDLPNFDPELVEVMGHGQGNKAIAYLRQLDDDAYDQRLIMWRKDGITPEHFVDQRLPLVEEIINDPDTGIFSVFPAIPGKPDLLAATLSQVSDAIDDVLENSSNGLNESSLDVRKLHRTLGRHSNDPQRVEMDFTTVHGSLVRQVAAGELPLSDENAALISALQEGAQGIRATTPGVAENRRILQEQALRELSPNAVSQISAAGPILEAITEGNLREQMHEDVLFLTQEMRAGPPRLRGVTREEAIVAGRDEVVRVLGRSARILLALRKSPELVHLLHDSAGFKAARIITTLASLVTLALLLF